MQNIHNFSDLKYRKNHIILSVFLIVVLTSISFWSSLDNGFTNWDDPVYVTENDLIKDLSWHNIKAIFTTFHGNFYHPLVFLSYAVDYALYGLNPTEYHATPGYHVTNLLLHIFNTFLVFWLIFMLSNRIFVSLVTALLFGVHPLHVESVTWISERKDVLSCFFFLPAIIYYLKYKKRGRSFYYCLSLFLFLLSLLSKPIVITLPFILLLCDYLSFRRFDRKGLLEKAPFFILSLMFGAITIYTQLPADLQGYTESFDPFRNFLIACRGMVFYLIKTMVPINLSALYPYTREATILSPEYLFPPFILLSLTVIIFLTRRYTRAIIFGALFFVIAILPVIKLMPFSGVAVVADRYMYIPSIGLFYIAGVVLYKAYTWEAALKKIRKAAVIIFLSILISTLSVLTYQRNDVWQNSETLWKDVLSKYPSSIAYTNYGLVYMDKGDKEQAINMYKKALTIDPNFSFALNNLGVVYLEKGLIDEAIVKIKQALTAKPTNPAMHRLHNNLGNAYRKKRLLVEAIMEYQMALQVRPDFANARRRLAQTLKEIRESNEFPGIILKEQNLSPR